MKKKVSKDYRALVEASRSFIETENSYLLTQPGREALLAGIENRGLDVVKSKTLSVYFETFGRVDGALAPTLGFLENGVTFRLRQKGNAHKFGNAGEKIICENYPGQASLKMVDVGFQTYADEIAKRYRPNAGVFKPRTRIELEAPFSYANLNEIHHDNLPEGGISSIIEGLVNTKRIEGITNLSDLAIGPIVATDVHRKKTKLYIDPKAVNSEKDFLSTWPHSEPTRQMEKREEWVKIELCVDQMGIKRPLGKPPLSEVVGASKNGLQNPTKFAYQGYKPVVEYEVLECGSETNDKMLVMAYADLGLGVSSYIKRTTGFPLEPTFSKGVTAIGALKECRPNGRLHDKYARLQKIAP